MKSKVIMGTMLTLLLVSMLKLAFNIQPARATGTIYIRPDGSVEGTDKIQQDGNVYSFTDNIYDSIVVERDNIVVDGAGYTLQGMGSGRGIFLGGGSNVTINNMEINAFDYGIDWGWRSSNNTISGNTITANNRYGIILEASSNNIISGNTITANNRFGIYIVNFSNNNTISGNCISANNDVGILIEEASNNTISGNTIINNGNGVFIDSRWYGPNKFCHNNFINNTVQAHIVFPENHTWDDGYPSGGNYWSDHIKVDDYCGINQDEPGSDGIADTAYIIDEDNVDNYPLMATSGAIDYVIQSLPSSEFDKPEEDVADIKSDFADKFADVEENIDEGNYERAIEHLTTIKEFAVEQIVESAERQEIISVTDRLIAYLQNFLSFFL